MLTPKQEKYVQNLIKGMSQRQAYRDAYPDDTSSDETIDSHASNLLNANEKVMARYKELLQKTEDNAIMSAIERKKWLTKVINGEIKEDIPIMTDIESDIAATIKCPSKLKTKLNALDILNKMDGEYITKIDGNISVDKIEDLL